MFEYIMEALRGLTQNLPNYDSTTKAISYTVVLGTTAAGFVYAAVDSYQTDGLSLDFAEKALIGCTAGAMTCGSLYKAYEYFEGN